MSTRARATSLSAVRTGGRRLSAVAAAVRSLAGANRKGVIPGSAAGRFWWRDRNRTQPWDPAVDLEKTVEFADDLTGNPVGWQLGANLTINGDFNTNLAGWTNLDTAPSATTWSAGAVLLTAASTGAARLRQQVAVEVGKRYRVAIRVVAITGTPTLQFSLGVTSGGDTAYGLIAPTTAGRYSSTFVATGTLLGLAFYAANAATGAATIDDVQVQEVIRDESWLGANLITNGDFSNGTTGWSGGFGGSTIANVSGALEITGAGGAFPGARQTIATVAGASYRVTATLRRGTSASTAVISPVSPSGFSGSTSSTSDEAVSFVFAATASTTQISVFINSATGTGTIYVDNITVREIPGHPIVSAVSGSGLVGSKRVNILQQTNTVSTARTATTVAGSYRIYVGSGSVTLSGAATGTFNAGTATFTATAGTLTVMPSGTATNVDVRLAIWNSFNLPAYQRVGDGTAGVFDYDDAGFPLHLKNVTGTQAAMTLGTVDMTAGDAGVLLANVVKLSETGEAVVAETSTTSTSGSGAVALIAPSGASTNNYRFRHFGSTVQSVTTPASFAAPHIAALIGSGDVSADSNVITVNGTQSATSSADLGTGNLGNHRLNIAGRDVGGTASLRFTGYYIGNLPALVAGDAGIDPLALSRELAAQGGFIY